MKLTQDQQKKIILIALLFAFVLYWYFFNLLPGFTKQEKSAAKKIEELQPKIKSAKGEIAAVKSLEAKVPEVSEKIETLRALVPDDAPVAWFPPKVRNFFKRHGIEDVTTRQKRALGEIGAGGFSQIEWIVDIPKVDAVGLGIALAGLEAEDPTVSVISVTISADSRDPEFQSATLVLSSIVKQ